MKTKLEIALAVVAGLCVMVALLPRAHQESRMPDAGPAWDDTPALSNAMWEASNQTNDPPLTVTGKLRWGSVVIAPLHDKVWPTNGRVNVQFTAPLVQVSGPLVSGFDAATPIRPVHFNLAMVCSLSQEQVDRIDRMISAGGAQVGDSFTPEEMEYYLSRQPTAEDLGRILDDEVEALVTWELGQGTGN